MDTLYVNTIDSVLTRNMTMTKGQWVSLHEISTEIYK